MVGYGWKHKTECENNGTLCEYIRYEFLYAMQLRNEIYNYNKNWKQFIMIGDQIKKLQTNIIKKTNTDKKRALMDNYVKSLTFIWLEEETRRAEEVRLADAAAKETERLAAEVDKELGLAFVARIAAEKATRKEAEERRAEETRRAHAYLAFAHRRRVRLAAKEAAAKVEKEQLRIAAEEATRKEAEERRAAEALNWEYTTKNLGRLKYRNKASIEEREKARVNYVEKNKLYRNCDTTDCSKFDNERGAAKSFFFKLNQDFFPLSFYGLFPNIKKYLIQSFNKFNILNYTGPITINEPYFQQRIYNDFELNVLDNQGTSKFVVYNYVTGLGPDGREVNGKGPDGPQAEVSFVIENKVGYVDVKTVDPLSIPVSEPSQDINSIKVRRNSMINLLINYESFDGDINITSFDDFARFAKVPMPDWPDYSEMHQGSPLYTMESATKPKKKSEYDFYICKKDDGPSFDHPRDIKDRLLSVNKDDILVIKNTIKTADHKYFNVAIKVGGFVPNVMIEKLTVQPPSSQSPAEQAGLAEESLKWSLLGADTLAVQQAAVNEKEAAANEMEVADEQLGLGWAAGLTPWELDNSSEV